jgi:hypothetical protein
MTFRNTSLATSHGSMMKMVVELSQRGELRAEGELGTKGVGVADTEKQKVDPSPGIPELFIYSNIRTHTTPQHTTPQHHNI